MAKSAEKVRDDVVETLADTTAAGAEKLAEGSERLTKTVKKTAKKTRAWADDVSGAANQRRLISISVVMLALIAVSFLFLRGNSEKKG
ncbi:MAG TPA: hypothetical protein VFS66_11085 [Acidimicrobiia bacterium]|nr:hypothetical protein [Acidimicrobiia bacterium]